MRKVEILDKQFIDDNEYYADRMYVTNSMLKTLSSGSTKNFMHRLENPLETDSLKTGSAFHCWILEQQKFNDRYTFIPKVNRRTKAGKEIYEEFVNNNVGKVFIHDKYLDIFEQLQVIINNHANVKNILNSAITFESTHTWKDIKTNVLCKAKADIVGEDFIADIKTTSRTGDCESFLEYMYTYKLHQQAAFYLSGLQKKHFYFIMCELNEPFNVSIYKLSQKTINKGLKIIDNCLNIYKNEVLNTSNYHSYTNYNLDKIVEV
jgi:hypothetical protein